MIDYRARALDIQHELAVSKRNYLFEQPCLSPAQRATLEAEAAHIRVIRHRNAEAARMKGRTSYLAILIHKINAAGLGHLVKEASDEAQAEGMNT